MEAQARKCPNGHLMDPNWNKCPYCEAERAAKKMNGQGTNSGNRIGLYEILKPIGDGGMAEVFSAKHLLMSRVVAIKTIHKHLLENKIVHKSFRREMEASAKISHKNVLTVFDAGIADERPYLVMEYVDGEDLGKIVKKSGALDFEDALDYVTQAARGLEEIHKQNIVHRDIKPHNMILDKCGNLKIFDFGICKLLYVKSEETFQSKSENTQRQKSESTLPKNDDKTVIWPGKKSQEMYRDSGSELKFSFLDYVLDDDALFTIVSPINREIKEIQNDFYSEPPSIENLNQESLLTDNSSQKYHRSDQETSSSDITDTDYLSDNGQKHHQFDEPEFIGTLGFISPEQIKNSSQVGFKADIYSLGCTLFYLLNGKTITDGSSANDAILAHIKGTLPSLSHAGSNIPSDLESVYKKMIAVDPKDRYESMHDLIEELEKVGSKPKVFISYRRADTIDATDRLFTSMRPKLGSENLFMDIDTIPAGVDFREHVKKEVGNCDVMLVVIGDYWLHTREDRSRRIDNPADFVRLEIESALEMNIPIIPILVGQARMPSPLELPSSIKELAYRNSAEVRPGKNYEIHVSQLLNAILSIFRAIKA